MARDDETARTRLIRNVGVVSASPSERVAAIRAGLAASRIQEIADAMHVSRAHLLRILKLPNATIGRKIRQGVMLSAAQAERVTGLEQLIGQVAAMVADSGDPQGFETARWVGEWLEQPVSALRGATPADFMDTVAGRSLVSMLLERSQAGVFA